MSTWTAIAAETTNPPTMQDLLLEQPKLSLADPFQNSKW